MAGNKASSDKPSKGTSGAPKSTPRQGPPAHTKKWAENVAAEAKGKTPPHGGPVIHDHT